jgi:small subunit ribosomal protein S1
MMMDDLPSLVKLGIRRTWNMVDEFHNEDELREEEGQQEELNQTDAEEETAADEQEQDADNASEQVDPEQDTEQDTDVKQYAIGDRITGKVIKVEDKHALIEFGYKIDAILPIGEISNVHIEKVADVLSEGDEIEVEVTKVTDEEIVVSKRRVDNEQAWKDLQQKLDEGEVFEVEVAEVVKGGLVVDVGLRGFIPASLVERHYVENFDDYKGKTLRVKVIELDQDKNKLILSQKAVLDEEADLSRQKRIESLEIGNVLEGTVQRITSFGVFVDIGEVDGLVHISELSWQRVETPADVVSEGDTVKVKVLKVDPDNQKVSLSIKATLPSPWEEAASKIHPGDVVEGTVKRLVSFGAFVEVLPGVEGLVHISQISNRRIGTPDEVLEEGQQVKAKVLDVNTSDERISLSIRELLEDMEHKEVEQFNAKEDSNTGVTLGDMFGDKLKKLK